MDVTGIRSWFGLVEQVAYAFSKTSLMQPFRNLLSKDAVYIWTDELQHAFETARSKIVKLVAAGVKTFQTNAWTCSITDWSRTGIGYALWQKWWRYVNIHPSCCKEGWALITCGSRFCTLAESRYHPIEGELLGLAWALEKTSYYTLGSEKLIVLVDHKPLLGLLTTRNLGEIENPRLMHLAERLLKWTFTIKNIAGATNYTPDALSRSPAGFSVCSLQAVNPADQQASDELEAQVLATSAASQILLMSWETVKNAAISDPIYATLLHAVQSDGEHWPDTLSEFKRFRQDLSTQDGVVLFKGRLVIPQVLRQHVLHSLHQAHQGPSGMALRCQQLVWWPAITEDLAKLRSSCNTCHRIAPSQSPMPPVDPPNPQYPFQLVSSDYFSLAGHTYLVMVDMYSN